MSTYELELTKILQDNGFFAKRGAGSTEIDVFAIYKSVPFTIEVKSSKEKKVYLSSDRLREQLEIYREHRDKYNKYTIYTFRHKTKKRVDHRWEVFSLDMSRTMHDNSYLEYGSGVVLGRFIDEVTKRIDEAEESGVLKWYGCKSFGKFLENLNE